MKRGFFFNDIMSDGSLFVGVKSQDNVTRGAPVFPETSAGEIHWEMRLKNPSLKI
jgi:hypothetical protein